MKPLLIVDGYNVIGAWKEAKDRAWSMDESRDQLARRLEDFAGYAGEEIVLVFDGYLSDRKTRTEEEHGGVTTVFTKHAETADSYIERLVAETPRYRSVRVATSDGLEQSQVLSTGATRLTSRELLREMSQARQSGLTGAETRAGTQRSPIGARLPGTVLSALEEMRRGSGTPEEQPEQRQTRKATASAQERTRHKGEQHGQRGQGGQEERDRRNHPAGGRNGGRGDDGRSRPGERGRRGARRG